MTDRLTEDRVIRFLVDWARQQAPVRAMLLTSTRTSPDAHVDLFSDYDVILVVTDIHPYFDDRAWLEDFGRVLVLYRDPIKLDYGIEKFAYITQYEDGLKIDFILWPLEMLPQVLAAPRLPDYLDVGYTVLMDKDGLTDGLQPPTYTAHIPCPPTRAEYENRVEEFFHEATYVAKHLWRGDLMAAKYNMDQAMKMNNLRLVLEWLIEIDRGWLLKPGAYGKGLKRNLPPKTWLELENTYAGADEQENWDALFGTIALFRRVAIEVGEYLGYEYPDGMDRRVMIYLKKVQSLDRRATSFPRG